jgi:hypothetical protein
MSSDAGLPMLMACQRGCWEFWVDARDVYVISVFSVSHEIMADGQSRLPSGAAMDGFVVPRLPGDLLEAVLLSLPYQTIAVRSQLPQRFQEEARYHEKCTYFSRNSGEELVCSRRQLYNFSAHDIQTVFPLISIVRAHRHPLILWRPPVRVSSSEYDLEHGKLTHRYHIFIPPD